MLRLVLRWIFQSFNFKQRIKKNYANSIVHFFAPNKEIQLNYFFNQLHFFWLKDNVYVFLLKNFSSNDKNFFPSLYIYYIHLTSKFSLGNSPIKFTPFYISKSSNFIKIKSPGILIVNLDINCNKNIYIH